MYCNFIIISTCKCVCLTEGAPEHLKPSFGSAKSNCGMQVTWPCWAPGSLLVPYQNTSNSMIKGLKCLLKKIRFFSAKARKKKKERNILQTDTIRKTLNLYPIKTMSFGLSTLFLDPRQQQDSGGTHLSTTTMGLSLPVRTIKPFQIMSAEDTIMAKFKTW